MSINPKQKDRFNPEQKKRFRADLDDFFSQEKRGGLDVWSYDDPKPWENLVQAAMTGKSSYYMTPVEQALLEEKSPEIDAEIRQNGKGVDTVFVRGTGTGEKLMPLVKSLNGNLRNVFLFDLSSTFTSLAADRISHARPEVITFEINYDFESEDRRLRFNAHSLGLELGGTLFNIASKKGSDFPSKKIEERLRKAATVFNHKYDGWFLITQHTNSNVSEILENYDDEFCHRVAKNALSLVNSTFATEGFSPDLFEHKPVYEDFGNGNGVIGHRIVIREDVKKRLEAQGVPLEFKIQGKAYKLTSDFNNATIDSYLPSTATFAQCAANADFRLHKSFPSKDGKMTLHLLKYSPGMNNRDQPSKNLQEPALAAA